MTDTAQKSAVWAAREAEGLSREAVTRLLDPSVSTKTLERWERGRTPVPRHRLRELAAIYRVRVEEIDGKRA